MKACLASLVLGVALGCHHQLPWSPAPVADDGCVQAGARLAELRCPEAFSPKGTPYAVVCHDAAQHGVQLRGGRQLDCLRAAKHCSEATACL